MNRYSLILTTDPDQVALAQEFRGKAFRAGESDIDEFDKHFVHGLVREYDKEVVAVFRIKMLNALDLDDSYSAQFYDLINLRNESFNCLEIGRFCISSSNRDFDIIRLIWSELTHFILEHNIDFVFGCSSFKGQNFERHQDCFIALKERHLAPSKLMPEVKSENAFRYADYFKNTAVNIKAAYLSMPSLLRSYLTMGGWVSDHAVIDNDLETIHVFTGLEVKKVPTLRREQLFRLAKSA